MTVTSDQYLPTYCVAATRLSSATRSDENVFISNRERPLRDAVHNREK